MTITDLNKIFNITGEDILKFNSSYGSSTNPTEEIFYPTLNSTDKTKPGKSELKGIQFINTNYGYNKFMIENSNVRTMLFNGKYWLASRYIKPDTSYASFSVRSVGDAVTTGGILCNSSSGSGFGQFEESNNAVRPVVSIKTNVIDISTDYKAEGEWKLK